MRFAKVAVSGMTGLLTGLTLGYALWGQQTAALTDALAQTKRELVTTKGWLLDEIEWSDERSKPDPRVPALGAQVAGQETRLSETEVRRQEMQDAMRRRAAEPPLVVAPRVAPQPPARRTSAVVKPAAPPRPVETKAVEPPASAAEVVAPQVVEPPAHSASPASPSPGTPPPSTTWVPSSPPPPVITSPAPSPFPAQVPPPSPPVAAAPRPTPPEAAASPGPAPRPSFDLRSRLREDWREIRRGVDSAGDDFRRAIDSVKRALE